MNASGQKSGNIGSIFVLLAGLYPFILLGPCIVLLSYPYPPPAWRMTPLYQGVSTAAGFLPLLAGFSAGWLKRFPLWSYAYTCVMVLFLIFGSISIFNGSFTWQVQGPLLAMLLVAYAALAALLIMTRRDLPLRSLFQAVKRDWTRLSLGLLVLPTFLFSSIDHDEDPALTPFVIGPSLVIVLTALLGLVLKNKRDRSFALAGGMILALLVRLSSGRIFILIYWVFAVIIVFAPILLENNQHSKQPLVDHK